MKRHLLPVMVGICSVVLTKIAPAAGNVIQVQFNQESGIVPDTNRQFKSIQEINAYISARNKLLDERYKGKKMAESRAIDQRMVSHEMVILHTKFLETHPSERNRSNLFLLMGIAHDRKVPEGRVRNLLASFPADCRNSETARKIEGVLARGRIENTSVAAFLSQRYGDTSGTYTVLSGNKTKDKLIIFWASWCSPCRAESKELLRHYASIDTGRIELISISLDTDPFAWKSALRMDRYPWKNLVDLNGFESKIATYLNIKAIPASVLTDRSGNILKVRPTNEEIIWGYKR